MGGKGSGGARRKGVRYSTYPFRPDASTKRRLKALKAKGHKIQPFIRKAVDDALDKEGIE